MNQSQEHYRVDATDSYPVILSDSFQNVCVRFHTKSSRVSRAEKVAICIQNCLAKELTLPA